MTAHELLLDLERRGIRIAAVADRLRVSGPVGTITPDLRASIESQKPALIALLSGRASATPASAQVGFRFVADMMELGDVCCGWSPSDWAKELRRKAERCERYRPDMADYYTRWAGNIEARLALRTAKLDQ